MHKESKETTKMTEIDEVFGIGEFLLVRNIV